MKTSRIISVILAVLIAVSAVAMLTGCNKKDDTAATTAATTATATTATTAATQPAVNHQDNTQAQNSNANGQQDANTGNGNSIGITSDEAIANVRNQVGSDAEILSCVEGTTPNAESFPCYVIDVMLSSGTTLTYYSGYQFCYTTEEVIPDLSVEIGDDSEIGISETNAISNVRSFVGESAEIVSITQGTAYEGPCYVITVSVQNDNGEFVNETYYSGYLFCYKAE